MNPREASAGPAAPWWRPSIKAHAWITVLGFYSSVLFVMAVLLLVEKGYAEPLLAALPSFGLPESARWIVVLVLMLAATIPGVAFRSFMRRKVAARCSECAGPAFLRIEGGDSRYFYKCSRCGARRDSGVEEGD